MSLLDLAKSCAMAPVYNPVFFCNYRFEEEKEAINIANNTQFGLGGKMMPYNSYQHANRKII